MSDGPLVPVPTVPLTEFIERLHDIPNWQVRLGPRMLRQMNHRYAGECLP